MHTALHLILNWGMKEAKPRHFRDGRVIESVLEEVWISLRTD